MSQAARLVPHADAVLRRVGDGAVLVHLGTSVVFELNRTATRAWELIASGATRDAAVACLMDEYAGSRDQIEADIDRLLSFLADRKLLTR